ncbi:MAG: aldehyde dehydrogenase family protein [Azospirillaceae bacterium]
MGYWYGDAGNSIAGAWCPAEGGGRATAREPASGEAIGTFAWSDRVDARRALEAARAAFEGWSRTPLWQRAAACRAIAAAVRAEAEALAELLAREQGKPLAEARFEIGKAADGFELAAETAKHLEGATVPTEDPGKVVMSFYRPRGVYAVVTPWNFPVNIPVEYLAPGLAAGNALVWCPAPTTALCAVALTRVCEAAGLPGGVLNLVTGEGATVGDEIVSSPLTDGVGFTGSAATGKRIAERAAGKPQLLEMGGNGPVVVFDDADLERAVEATASGCFVNAGQVCSSSERIIVQAGIHDAFVDAMIAAAKAHRLGHSMDPETTMGPLNNRAVHDKVSAHVRDAMDRGAVRAHGGFVPQDLPGGLFYQPTVLTDVAPESLINREETFGPVAPILKVRDEAEALAIARDNRYGLASSVFTRDIERAWFWAEAMPTGLVNINDTSNYWELQIPFGGYAGKDSGVGRIGGRHTLVAMSELKTVSFTRPLP